MSILQPTSSDSFVHVEDVRKFIAKDLNVEPSHVTLMTQLKNIPPSDMWSSGRTEF